MKVMPTGKSAPQGSRSGKIFISWEEFWGMPLTASQGRAKDPDKKDERVGPSYADEFTFDTYEDDGKSERVSVD